MLAENSYSCWHKQNLTLRWHIHWLFSRFKTPLCVIEPSFLALQIQKPKLTNDLEKVFPIFVMNTGRCYLTAPLLLHCEVIPHSPAWDYYSLSAYFQSCECSLSHTSQHTNETWNVTETQWIWWWQGCWGGSWSPVHFEISNASNSEWPQTTKAKKSTKEKNKISASLTQNVGQNTCEAEAEMAW